jgi:hypothetical protein
VRALLSLFLAIGFAGRICKEGPPIGEWVNYEVCPINVISISREIDLLSLYIVNKSALMTSNFVPNRIIRNASDNMKATEIYFRAPGKDFETIIGNSFAGNGIRLGQCNVFLREQCKAELRRVEWQYLFFATTRTNTFFFVDYVLNALVRLFGKNVDIGMSVNGRPVADILHYYANTSPYIIGVGWVSNVIDSDIWTHPRPLLGAHFIQLTAHSNVSATQGEPLQDGDAETEKSSSGERNSRHDKPSRYSYEWGFVGGLTVVAVAVLLGFSMQLGYKAFETAWLVAPAIGLGLIAVAVIVHGLWYACLGAWGLPGLYIL